MAHLISEITAHLNRIRNEIAEIEEVPESDRNEMDIRDLANFSARLESHTRCLGWLEGQDDAWHRENGPSRWPSLHYFLRRWDSGEIR